MDIYRDQTKEDLICQNDGIRRRQRAILAEIAIFDRSSKDGSELEVQKLEEDYNSLVDNIAELVYFPPSDPLEKLPLELWTRVIREVVDASDDSNIDTLLNLTNISHKWCQALISLPLLWTSIHIETSEEDLMAKLIISLQFSDSCALDVYIAVSEEIWRKIAPIIISESRRIHLLSIRPRNPSDAQIILQDFSDLAMLERLEFSPLVTLDAIYLQSINPERMPILKSIHGPSPLFGVEPWRCFITWIRLSSWTFRREDIQSWGKLPNLESLDIMESASLEHPEPFSVSLEGSLSSITTFSYWGQRPDRFLRCLGPKVEVITELGFPMNVFHQTFSLLPQFPYLRRVSLSILDPVGPEQPIFPIATLRTVTTLALWFSVADTPTTQKMIESFYQTLVTCFPCVQEFCMSNGVLTEKTLDHIYSLDSLGVLNLDNCELDPRFIGSYTFKAHLTSATYLGTNDLVSHFTGMVSPHLQTLYLGIYNDEVEYVPHLISAEPNNDNVYIPRMEVLGDLHPNVIYLTIVINNSTFWDLKPSSTLRELEICARSEHVPSLRWGGDILEAIMMRPSAFPALDTIKLRGDFFEWDILMLLLERKNIPNQDGIAPIKALIVDINLPYCLLEPISALLQGRFPKRRSYASFSIEKVGERVWNEHWTGCEQCCYTFRACSEPIEVGDFYDIENVTLGWKYQYPFENIPANPPLSTEIAKWLSGKYSRRVSYLRGYEKMGRRMRRINSCQIDREGLGGNKDVAITKNTLDDTGIISLID